MAGRRSPTQSRSRATYEAIVEAAAQVFERHGYAAGTTNRIAERAGVSIGTLYQYFEDKDAVLHAVVDQHLDDGAAALAPVMRALAADPEPETALALALEAMLALHAQRPRLHRLLFEETPLPASVHERLRELESASAAVLEDYLRRRPDPPADPRLTAELIVSAIEVWGHRQVLHPSRHADDSITAEAARLLASAL